MWKKTNPADPRYVRKFWPAFYCACSSAYSACTAFIPGTAEKGGSFYYAVLRASERSLQGRGLWLIW